MIVNRTARTGGIIGTSFRYSLTRGDSNEYTQYTIFNIYIKKKITLNLSQICSYGILFQGTREGVRNSCGKLAISVRAIEVLLYLHISNNVVWTQFHLFLARLFSKKTSRYCHSPGIVGGGVVVGVVRKL